LINVLVFTQIAQPWSFLSSHPLFGYNIIIHIIKILINFHLMSCWHMSLPRLG
jgi:hypothetical protein